ncbi:IS1595 family transposase [Myroides sp. 1354]|uniref:IS1595 family transposase n=1 Tax=unclassified Myroides TaxID=2642485 RepID=UPI00258219AC|nr:IS1595 family transposase [Myroides sp. R163-1]MDM1057408.1 IS1595 family transposase [Myroides sp. 1354]MDM1070693.1 IS1595 family transposase [Myroides sp. 1372]
MNSNTIIFKSLINLMETLQTENDCREYLENLRWNNEPICPHCGSVSENHYRLRAKGIFNGMYKCKHCRNRFTVTIGTMFEGSHIKLKKWFLAIYLFASHKKGISSVQLSKDINVTQKTAWFMLSRIRHNFRDKSEVVFEGITQVDETYIGGKNKNRSKNKKIDNTQGRSLKSKIPVFGLISNGYVYTKVIPDTKGKTLKGIIDDLVVKGSIIVSDGWKGYKGLSKEYIHKIIEHNKGIYVKDQFHTNSIEGFWSQLKRGIIGIYHITSPKHLSKYCNEFTFRFNTRKLTDGERFNLALISADDKLEYKELIDKF